VLSRAKEDVVMMVELSIVEQRYDAVREVLDGATITDVATRYEVDIRWLPRSRPASSRCAGLIQDGGVASVGIDASGTRTRRRGDDHPHRRAD
jgi:hypothetical protein